MAWIEVHQSLRDHRKTIDLAERLGVSEACAVGHLLFIWLWALDNANDGLLTTSPQVIAKIAAFCGDANAFQSALIESGYVDQVGDSLVIHDWDDYAGKLIAKRKSDAERKRKERASKGQTRDGSGTVPNLTKYKEHVVSVFEYWRLVMEKDARTQLDEKRQKAILRAFLVIGEEGCRQAIDGCKLSDWNMGRDPRSNGKKWNDLTLIFRDAEHWEGFTERTNRSNGHHAPTKETTADRKWREMKEAGLV
jgi:hypothetical protein